MRSASRLPAAPLVCAFLLSAPLLSATAAAQTGAPATTATPLQVARAFAARYPQTGTPMNYIPALSWTGQLRLTELTGEPEWGTRARAGLAPFLDGTTSPTATPYRLTALAGLAVTPELTPRGVELLLAQPVAGPTGAAPAIPYATGWTDDMYMATVLLARSADGGAAPVVGRLLIGYAERLQRDDGLFVHAETGPFAWGRGNGFAALGLVEALTHLPTSWGERGRVLDIYRRQMGALARHQTDDGSWRQVVDQAEAYRELTVTAMTVTAMARGVRMGWLDRATYLPVIERGWGAVLARIGLDGSVRDACTNTPAGTTLAFYLERGVVNGFDDRAGGLVLLAAIEMEELQRGTR